MLWATKCNVFSLSFSHQVHNVGHCRLSSVHLCIRMFVYLFTVFVCVLLCNYCIFYSRNPQKEFFCIWKPLKFWSLEVFISTLCSLISTFIIIMKSHFILILFCTQIACKKIPVIDIMDTKARMESNAIIIINGLLSPLVIGKRKLIISLLYTDRPKKLINYHTH
jgi:hypothetical protein